VANKNKAALAEVTEALTVAEAVLNKKTLLSQRWPRDAPYI